jgi:hypothetical protein
MQKLGPLKMGGGSLNFFLSYNTFQFFDTIINHNKLERLVICVCEY